ncbi:YciI family protein [Antrihabitans cavernicola]|uniref:YCII-related domain-containing protein n=1 Tax=Antrihabitans cavernicola TaxID=2495913 RepID=A0A5A7SE40_9NOCA|nr:YciI family protein [Spelaeibacter cavernicola]KAA0023649.1 hypothetical protein FOY51_09745 [Spelaeibacter cavernicola]
MKYMIMMFGDAGTMMETQTPEWVRDMIAFMHNLNSDLVESGEFVFAEGLVDSTQAKTVRIQNAIPVPTDGPFAETKESLIGFWIVDVESEERAIAITSKIVNQIQQPVELRRVADAPPEPV